MIIIFTMAIKIVVLVFGVYKLVSFCVSACVCLCVCAYEN